MTVTEFVWVRLHQGTCDYWVRPDQIVSVLSLLGSKQRNLKTRVYLANGHEAEVTETAEEVLGIIGDAVAKLGSYWKSEDD